MTSKHSFENCFILKIDYFSQSSAVLHLLTQQGPARIMCLSYLKKYPYHQHELYLSRHLITASSSRKTLYLREIEPEHMYFIPSKRLFYVLYIRDLIEFFSRAHFEPKIYHSYERFFHLLAHCDHEPYLYYALLSFQFILLSHAGLGSPSAQIKQFFDLNIMTIDQVELFQKKQVSQSCFLSLQQNIAHQLTDSLGYYRPQGYFKLWTQYT